MSILSHEYTSGATFTRCMPVVSFGCKGLCYYDKQVQLQETEIRIL